MGIESAYREGRREGGSVQHAPNPKTERAPKI